MAITQTREIARADMNDSYGVTIYQESEQVELTTDEAREYAAELLRAADQADAIEAEDQRAAFGSHECNPFIVMDDGTAVL